MNLIPNEPYQHSTHLDQWENSNSSPMHVLRLDELAVVFHPKLCSNFNWRMSKPMMRFIKSLIQQKFKKTSKIGLDSLVVHSQAIDKEEYLKRPDLGYLLNEDSRQRLTAHDHTEHTQSFDVCIVVENGLFGTCD